MQVLEKIPDPTLRATLLDEFLEMALNREAQSMFKHRLAAAGLFVADSASDGSGHSEGSKSDSANEVGSGGSGGGVASGSGSGAGARSSGSGSSRSIGGGGSTTTDSNDDIDLPSDAIDLLLSLVNPDQASVPDLPVGVASSSESAPGTEPEDDAHHVSPKRSAEEQLPHDRSDNFNPHTKSARWRGLAAISGGDSEEDGELEDPWSSDESEVEVDKNGKPKRVVMDMLSKSVDAVNAALVAMGTSSVESSVGASDEAVEELRTLSDATLIARCVSRAAAAKERRGWERDSLEALKRDLAEVCLRREGRGSLATATDTSAGFAITDSHHLDSTRGQTFRTSITAKGNGCVANEGGARFEELFDKAYESDSSSDDSEKSWSEASESWSGSTSDKLYGESLTISEVEVSGFFFNFHPSDMKNKNNKKTHTF